jgi:hypothetical protein
MNKLLIILTTLLFAAFCAMPAAAVRVKVTGEKTNDAPAAVRDEAKAALFATYTQTFCAALEDPADSAFDNVFNIPFLSIAVVPDEMMEAAGKKRPEIDQLMADSLRQTFTRGQIRNCTLEAPSEPVNCMRTYQDFEPSIMGGIPKIQIVQQLGSAHRATKIQECVVLPMNASGLGRDTVETLPFLIGWNGSEWRALGFLIQQQPPDAAEDSAPGTTDKPEPPQPDSPK